MAAGTSCSGGFYFFEEARAAEAGSGLPIGRQREVRKVGAPAMALGVAGETGSALGALLLHGESMA